jgi:hypothetical protein
LDENYVTFTADFFPIGGQYEFSIIFQYKESSFQQIVDTLTSNCIAKYGANDPCLFVVNRFSKISNYFNVQITDEERNLINLACYEGKYPVSNFYVYNIELNGKETVCNLPERYDIYIIEAKKGNFDQQNKLRPNEFMPSNWKNGMSRGYAIDESHKTIIFWLVIW